jgi:hypothetical protein
MKNSALPILAAALLTACSSSEPSGGASKPSDGTPIKPVSTEAAATPPQTIATNVPGAVATGAQPAAPTTAAATAAAPVVDPGPPVCSRAREKVWGSGANKLTGLTTKRVDGKTAIGFAVGVEPRVLLIEKTGAAKVYKVEVGAGAEPPKGKDGYRSLMRVSPTSIKGDTARAFIDYRDDFKDKRRRVSCGPADAAQAFLEFNGMSYLDINPKPTGEEKKKVFSWKKEGGYVELRDCRTFITRDTDEVWALGSVLRGVEKPDGTNEWKMVFLIDFGAGDNEIVLHETALKDDPPKLLTYEIPTSRRVKDKGQVVATRFGGALMVGVLDQQRKLKGSFKTYRGYPTMPDIGSTEDELLLMTGIGAGAERSLKALRIPKDTLDLPTGYVSVPLEPMEAGEGAEKSFTSPELTVDKRGQRWLAYVEGPKGKGHIRVAPLTEGLKPAGRSFSVTEGEVFASEGRLVSLDDGRLLIAYLRETAGNVELVTEQLSCEVKK